MDGDPNRRRGFRLLGCSLHTYLGLAYVALPACGATTSMSRGSLELPMVTRTATGIPGDSLNVGLVGYQEDVLPAAAAGWFPADPVTFRSSIAISAAWCWIGPTAMRRSVRSITGQGEQFAFEKPDGRSPSVAITSASGGYWNRDRRPPGLARRRHLRSRRGPQPLHRSGHPSHRPDIDAERDLLMQDLTFAGMLDAVFQISGIGPTLFGRNGGDDPYYTDGEIEIGSLVANGVKRIAPPAVCLRRR